MELRRPVEGVAAALSAWEPRQSTTIAGEEDRAYDTGEQHAREVQAAIPESRVSTVADAGQALLLEQPAIVTEAIVEFLAKIERA